MKHDGYHWDLLIIISAVIRRSKTMKHLALTAPSLPRRITVIKLICAITYVNDPHYHKETRNKVIKAS